MKISVRQISIAAVMAALSIILSIVSIKTDTSKFTIEGFPLMVVGIIYGPIVGGLAGLVSGFISQVIFYGITPTTPIWMMSSLVWGLGGGIFHFWLRKNNHSLFRIIVAVLSISFLVTFTNTLAMILDGLIYDYPTTYVWVNLIFRVAISAALSVGYIVLLYSILPRLMRSTNNSMGLIARKNYHRSNETSLNIILCSIAIFLVIFFVCTLIF